MQMAQIVASRQSVSRPVSVLLLAAALLVGACGASDATPAPTPASPTTAPTGTAATTTPPAGSASVRDIDFTAAHWLTPLLEYFGSGHVEPARVVYTDLTGDGSEEAVAIVESGGTLGDLGAAIYRVRDGQVELFSLIDAGGKVEVRFPELGESLVVATEGVWANDDPRCCPSRLLERVYHWNGEEIVLLTEQEFDNPDR